MFFTEWEVLLVDDEPDVLNISKLAMQNFEVYGLPLKIYTAESKAKALEFFKIESGPIPRPAIAFVDVVMENDSAGLELCQAIRQEMGNKLTQLFIRTGQPGVAPERAVIDGYDINGYFTKTEATEDKLYSLVKSGVRQYLWTFTALSTVRFLGSAIANLGSRVKSAQKLQHAFAARGGRGRQPQGCIMVGDQILGSLELDEQTAIAWRDRLTALKGTALSADGGTYVKDDKDLLIRVAPQGSNVDACLMARTTFTPPEDQLMFFYQFLTGLATIWEQAK